MLSLKAGVHIVALVGSGGLLNLVICLVTSVHLSVGHLITEVY